MRSCSAAPESWAGRNRAVSELAAEHLRGVGVDVRTGVTPTGARSADGGAVVALDDGTDVGGDVVVFGTGPALARRISASSRSERSSTSEGPSSSTTTAEPRRGPGPRRRHRVMPFTHVAKYQGRIVADNILGRARTASYDGIPRVVFVDPEIAAVGRTAAQATQAGIAAVTATVELPEVISRPWTYEREPRGELGVVADADANVLVGAWAVAPLAGEWIHLAALAIRARIGIDVLLDQVAQFPTYTEGYLKALEALPHR